MFRKTILFWLLLGMAAIGIAQPPAVKADRRSSGPTDTYWQYYSDCDRWNVVFASPIPKSSDVDATVPEEGATSRRDHSKGNVLGPLLGRFINWGINWGSDTLINTKEAWSNRLQLTVHRISNRLLAIAPPLSTANLTTSKRETKRSLPVVTGGAQNNAAPSILMASTRISRPRLTYPAPLPSMQSLSSTWNGAHRWSQQQWATLTEQIDTGRHVVEQLRSWVGRTSQLQHTDSRRFARPTHLH